MTWIKACVMINLIISVVNIFSLLLKGVWLSSFYNGFYKIREIDPSKSMMILIQSICIGWSGLSPRKTAPKRAIIAATKLIVSCRARNFLMMLEVCLPHLIVVMIDLKLSFRMTMSEAYFAVSLQVRPIDRLTSALRSAPISLVPLPATATTCPHSFRPIAKSNLSSAEAR